MRRLAPCFFVVLAGGACGLNVVGTIEGTPSNVDAGLDARAPDARDLRGDGDAANVDAADDAATTLCSAGQVHCGATCVDADDCATCGATTILCKLTRACVTSCDSCVGTGGAPNHPILCVACDPKQDNPVATCEANAPATFCLSGDYSQAYRNGPGRECDCSDTKVANCPAENQVCISSKGTDDCKTCGAPATSGGECKGGRTCNTSVSPARCQ